MLSIYFKSIIVLLFGLFITPAETESTHLYKHTCKHEIIAETTPGTEAGRIRWNASERLTWDDFEARPDFDDELIAALTSSAISYRYYCKDNQLVVTVEAVFRKQESWVKPEAETPHYLEHEQMHFDITEIYARKMRQELAKSEFKCYEKWKLEQIANNVLDDWRAKEKEYDWDTKYSLDEEKQSVWFFKVNSELFDFQKWGLKDEVAPIEPLKYDTEDVIGEQKLQGNPVTITQKKPKFYNLTRFLLRK